MSGDFGNVPAAGWGVQGCPHRSPIHRLVLPEHISDGKQHFVPHIPQGKRVLRASGTGITPNSHRKSPKITALSSVLWKHPQEPSDSPRGIAGPEPHETQALGSHLRHHQTQPHLIPWGPTVGLSTFPLPLLLLPPF